MLSYEQAILREIREAHIQDKKILELGIPSKIVNELPAFIKYKKGKKIIKKLFGIPVEYKKTLRITTEFSRFTRK